MTPEQQKIHDVLIKRASDNGLILELGWLACLDTMEPKAEYANDLRLAYYAGAQHLFASIMVFMDEDHEPTKRDMDRMTKLL